jgi:hypothetical protein
MQIVLSHLAIVCLHMGKTAIYSVHASTKLSG